MFLQTDSRSSFFLISIRIIVCIEKCNFYDFEKLAPRYERLRLYINQFRHENTSEDSSDIFQDVFWTKISILRQDSGWEKKKKETKKQKERKKERKKEWRKKNASTETAPFYNRTYRTFLLIACVESPHSDWSSRNYCKQFSIGDDNDNWTFRQLIIRHELTINIMDPNL